MSYFSNIIIGITVGEKPCTQILWVSQTEVRCQIPSGTGKDYIQVQIGDLYGSSAPSLYYTYPGNEPTQLIDQLTCYYSTYNNFHTTNGS
jgi:hypothetical protein